jgi:hypothetical protein
MRDDSNRSLSPRNGRLFVKRSLAGAVLLLAASTTLAGCIEFSSAASVEPSASVPAPSPSELDAPGAAVRAQVSSAVGCSVLTQVLTTIQNAQAGHTRGALSDEQYVALLNTVPTTLNLDNRRATEPEGLAAAMANLQVQVSQTPQDPLGAVFDPRDQAFLGTLNSAIAACKAEGVEAYALSEYGG